MTIKTGFLKVFAKIMVFCGIMMPGLSAYADNEIKIATNAYNDAQFAPVETALNSAVSTIKDVVANTITQTSAIAQIASDKQTRPDSECPADETCLLVEDADGTPHWYEIVTEYLPPLPSGYTRLKYIYTPAGSGLNTGLTKADFTYPIIETKFKNGDSSDTDKFGTSENANGEIIWDLAPGINNVYLRYGRTTNAMVPTFEPGYGKTDIMFRDAPHTLRIGGSAPATPIYVDGVLIGTFGNGIAPDFSQLSSTATITINSARGRINSATTWYSFKVIEENGPVLFDGIPAKRDSDNEIGMYDTVTNTFFTNTGTGTFTAGPVAQ